MAFNPFHAFRKHQKTLLAGLTILAMVTFILSSGTLSGGDFFGEMLRVLGGRSRVAEAATLYGRRISQQEMASLRQRRLLASEYTSKATAVALYNVQSSLVRSLEKEPALQNELKQAMFYASLPPEYQAQFQGQAFNQLNMLRFRLEQSGKKRE